MTPSGWLGRKTSTQTNIYLQHMFSFINRCSQYFLVEEIKAPDLEYSYHTYPKYSDTSIPYHTCSVIWTTTIHNLRLCLKIAGWVANSVDPDEMPHSAASHQGLHCLLRPVCPNTYGKYDTMFPSSQKDLSKQCWSRSDTAELPTLFASHPVVFQQVI